MLHTFNKKLDKEEELKEQTTKQEYLQIKHISNLTFK